MKMSNPQYAFDVGRPVADLGIDGIASRIIVEQKFARTHGLIDLGRNFLTHVPEVIIPANPDDSQRKFVLRGFTDDPIVFSIWETLVEMGKTGELPND